MIAHLVSLMASRPPTERKNYAREYLQVYLLRMLHEAKAHSHLAFVGGTALRLLHGLPRFSEDLDFSWEPVRASSPQDLAGTFRTVKTSLERAGYTVSAKMTSGSAVTAALFRFERLPIELGWSQDPRIALTIKVEVDVRPPAGAGIETTLIQRVFPVAVRHYDLPSLFAGKLNAILTRSFTKGRDWFDLAWYLTEHRGLEPNAALLSNALAQFGQAADAVPWREAIRRKLASLRWAEVLADLEPFVERRSDLDHLQPSLIAKLL